MSPLRQTAFKLLEAAPEEKLYAIIQLITSEESSSTRVKENIDLSKYSGRGGDMFGSVEAVENYIKDLRSDGK